MSFWKKESKTHFVRSDKTGKVIDVFHSGDEPKERKSKTPIRDALMKQHYEKHPEDRPSAKVKKRVGGVIKYFDDYSLKYAKSHQGTRQPSSRPRQSSKPRQPLGSYSFENNFNPIGDRFDTGMTSPKRKKKTKPRKKYAIVGGKAYIIAGADKKKKKKTTKKQQGFGVFDSRGFMR